MKKLFLLLAILIPIITFAQNQIIVGTGFNRVKIANDIAVTGTTYLGIKDTTFTPTQSGAVVSRPGTGFLYVYNSSGSGQHWYLVNAGNIVWNVTGSSVGIQIGLGPNNGGPIAGTNNAGFIDTARVRFIDSLRTGLKQSVVTVTHAGAGLWNIYTSSAGDTLYGKDFKNGKYTLGVTNTDSSFEYDVDTASLRTLWNNAYLSKAATLTINDVTQNLSPNATFTVSGGGGGSGAVKQIIAQSNTGLSVNTPVYINSGGTWVVADTNNFAMAVVDSLISTTGFELTFDGVYHAASHGLTVGSYYYITEPAGTITTTSPNESQPILIPIDANDVLVKIYRPNNFGAAVNPQIDTTGVLNGYSIQWSSSLQHFISVAPGQVFAGPGLTAYGGDSLKWGSTPFTGNDTTKLSTFAWLIGNGSGNVLLNVNAISLTAINAIVLGSFLADTTTFSSESFGVGAGSGASFGVNNGSGGSFVGKIDIVTGTGPSASAVILTINLRAGFGDGGFTPVLLSPANAAAAALTGNQLVWADAGNSAIALHSGSTALAVGVEYKWNYIICGHL